MDVSHSLTFAALGPLAARDIERGINAGRLHVSDEGVALSASGGALLAVMRSVLERRAPENADVHHAEGVLRLLGLPSAEAAEVARRPLSTVELSQAA